VTPPFGEDEDRATATPGRLIGKGRAAVSRAEATALVPVVAEYRLRDRNVRPEEADRIRALVARLV
jgi:hypothetical protein